MPVTPAPDHTARMTIARRIGEYLSIASSLHETKTSREEYQAANALAWELAMLLPPEMYRGMVSVIVGKTSAHVFVIHARRWLLGDDAGDLEPNDLAYHAPGIGKGRHP